MSKIANMDIQPKLSQLINSLHGEHKEYLIKFFNKAPRWLLDSIKINNIKKNTIIIREETPVDTIYILVTGIVKAVDYRFLGNSYNYMWFHPIKSFGSMEIILDLDTYQSTLSTMTPCTILTIPRHYFEKWIKSDVVALGMEVKTMVSYLLEEAVKERSYLFMEGNDRVIYTITQIYEQTLSNEECIIQLTQQDFSDCTGLSIKTIHRALKKLEEDSLIERIGHKIKVRPSQYHKMKDYISDKI